MSVSAEDYERAIEVLREESDGVIVREVGKRWRTRAADHLADRLDDYFRERPAIRTEQHAMAIIREMADNLRAAGEALNWAAARLKSKGDTFGASQTKQAAVETDLRAQALIGSA